MKTLLKFTLILFMATTLVGFMNVMKKQNPSESMIEMIPGNPYADLWKKVEQAESKGLTETALAEVENIYSKASADKNGPQIIKALIHVMKFTSFKEEEFIVKNVARLRSEIDKAKFPEKQILQSMLGETFWNYYNRNYWRFANRTDMSASDEKDIRTWTQRKISEEAMGLFLASLENSAQLKLTQTQAFKDVLILGSGSKLRPTLYDFLAHRAINFFANDRLYLTQPAFKFEIRSPEAFSPAKEFVNLILETSDTQSLKYHSLLLFQELTQMHLQANRKDALINIELERLEYVKQHAVVDNKNDRYEKGLAALQAKYKQHPMYSMITWKMGSALSAKGAGYEAGCADDIKWAKKKAVQMLSEVLEMENQDSIGVANCKNLKAVLQTRDVSLMVENVNSIQKPFRIQANYQNLNNLHFKVIKITKEQYKRKRNENSKDWIKRLNSFKAVLEWAQPLPNDGDYNPHTTELKVDALKQGFHVLLAATTADFTILDEMVAHRAFHVSNLGYLVRKIEEHTHEVLVTDRNTGMPLQGAKVAAFTREYDYKIREYKYIKLADITTDADGIAAYYAKKGSRQISFEVTYGDDFLTTDEQFYQYNRDDPFKPKTVVRLFSDRAIYRPGQTVYFKGLVLTTGEEAFSIKPNHKTKVTFFDVNNQKVSELNLVSNEYGTVSGSFVTPLGVLNGSMSIRSENYSRLNFRVEEYKRPKFEVTFDPVKGSFKLGEKVKVSGKAQAYAGSNIDGADVQYRVVRKARFPFWWGWWKPQPSSEEMEITSGVAKTDEQGAFEVEFQAIPDESILEKDNPTFTFTVYADVTDISGETHSSTVAVSVGYQALKASVTIGSMVNKSDANSFKISTLNLNGEFEPAKGNIKITRLNPEDRMLRKRLWDNPDMFQMSKEEFVKDFPNDVYDRENEPEKWNTIAIAYDQAFDSEKADSFVIPDVQKWPEGKYIIELTTKDKFGKAVTWKQLFTFYSPEEKGMPEPKLFWTQIIENRVEPGENAKLLVGSAEKGMKFLFEVEHKGTIEKREWINISEEKKIIEIPVEERHRGNFSVTITAVRHGRSFVDQTTLYVPWTNKKLEIEKQTFRNKLLPGQKEEWKLKVSGPGGEKIMAEMLAGMYDASLDAFVYHGWGLDLWPSYYSRLSTVGQSGFAASASSFEMDRFNQRINIRQYEYDRLNWFGYSGEMGYPGNRRFKSKSTITTTTSSFGGVEGDEMAVGGAMMFDAEEESAPAPMAEKSEESLDQDAGDGFGEDKWGEEGKAAAGEGEVQVRTNLNETAFFFPHLETNEEGEILISFTIPEALTRWKLMGLSHTKDLKTGYLEAEVVTQKELMVMPNAPRFFREGDKMTFTAKVSNLAETDLSGSATLELFDAITMEPIDKLFGNGENVVNFTAKKGQSAPLSWEIAIPEKVQAVTYRVIAKAGNFSDGEESALPILSNRMMVTEAMPLPVRPKQTKDFTFDKMVNNKSATLTNHKLTLEFTSNPAWYAVQALPYLMEYPYECAEQVFSRFYANSLATHVANSSPKIQRVFDSWKTRDKEALLSNLEKNQELKYLLLEETPWVLQAQDETERKKRVGLLFDLNKMSQELDQALRKLQKAQVANGAWPWFTGMRESRYITQHIVTGMGHLDHLSVKNIREDQKTWTMVKKAIGYLDQQIAKDYKDLLRREADMEKNNLGSTQIQYLYARSYFKDVPIQKAHQKAVNYYTGQAQQYWLENSRYMQGMIALALHRGEVKEVPMDIIRSLKENALLSEELGMYWKNTSGWWWYQAPIETQALLIEAFDEVADDKAAVEEMKLWLLKQKQTTDWKTTKATVEACYALLLRGTDVLAESKLCEITMGGKKIDPMSLPDTKVEAGTGYFKTSWMGDQITPKMGKVKVSNPNEVAAWGAVYWQYFEQLDKITYAETPLQLKKELFLQKNSPTGPVLHPIDETTQLKPGDLVKVRIELRSDRNFEYVHMKDMRGACMEPINVLSSYKWQDGLGYYESTKDGSTNFFIGYLSKGTYVFEYPLRVTHKGDFSNGITTIQCMYAPEYTSHSEGIRVKVE